MNCRVSVIVPVYNCKKFLARAIDSVVNQNDFSLDELVLIDDGSTDGSAEICDFYKDKYTNIKVLHQKNSGVSVARNNGLSIAEGEWVFFLDSDDYLLEDAFSKLLKLTDADLISGKYISNVTIHDNFSNYFNEDSYRIKDVDNELNKILIDSQIFYNCWSRLYKKSIIDEYHVKFPIGVKYAEDMVFVYTYLKYCNSFAFCNEAVYYYYVNTENTTYVVPKSFDVYYYIYNWQKEYFSEKGVFQESLIKKLDSVFVYRSFLSFKIAADSLPFFESVRYIREMLNNNIFMKLYSNENIAFEYKFDKMIDNYIKNKSAFHLVILVRFYKMKAALFNLIKGDING